MSYVLGASNDEREKIEKISLDVTLNEEEKSHQLKSAIKEIKKKKQGDFASIVSVSNSMMGSALLVMPVNFYKAGLFSGVLASLFMAYVSYKTCTLVIRHSKTEEIDYPEAINRVLGKKWEIAYNLMSMLVLYFVSIIHFILMANCLFTILKNIFPNTDTWALPEEITFNTMSLQYTGLICFAICTIILSWKDLSGILKIVDKGIYAILTFCAFITFLGIYALAHANITFSATGSPGEKHEGKEMILFTYNINTLVGIFGIAYLIHNMINGMVRNNSIDIKNNEKIIGTSYTIVFILYSILGIMGMFAVGFLYNGVYSDYQKKEEKLPETIMEILTKNNPVVGDVMNVFGTIALFMIIIQLTSVLPILCFFCRRQFFSLLGFNPDSLSNIQFHLFNLTFNLTCLAVEMLAFDPSLVISITGALGGFLLIYVIPIYLHIKCLYYREDKSKVRSNETDENREKQKVSLVPDGEDEDHMCIDHTEYLKKSKVLILIFYAIVFVIGVLNIVAQGFNFF